jgi:hypothetical protein
MPDLDAVGEAVTGGLAARAVEPARGNADGYTQETNCLNCGTMLSGEYCHACGQHAHVHRNLRAFWHDLAHSVLHFEGKVWRTLPLLAWHPGTLTRRYVEGERAKFVSPLALFLFSVFLMFAVFSVLGGPTDFTAETTAQDRAEAQRELAADRAEAQRDLAALEQELRQARSTGAPTSAIESRVQAARTRWQMQERAYELAMRLAGQQEQRDAARAGDGAEGRRGINILSETGWEPLDRAVAKAEANPSLLLYKLQANAYKFSWALIPISLPFLWLLFLHRRRYRQQYGAYDHLVFITYSISFMSLGAIALTLLRPLGVGGAVTGTAMTFVPPIHICRQLRGAYQLSRWSAVWRTFALLVFAGMALMLFLMLLLALGLF